MQEDEQDNKDSVKEHEMLDVECSSEEEQRMDLIQEGRSEDDATEKGERRGDTGLEPGMRKEWGVEMQDEEEGEPQGKDDATEKGERRGDTGLEPGMTKEWGVEMQDEEEGEPQGKDDATEKGERRGDTGLEPGMRNEWGVEM